MANTNEQIAREVLDAVGGKNNISFVTYCITRLRFNLKDMNLPDQEKIKAINGVLGVVISGGQFQVIIDQNVTRVYSALCSEAGILEQSAVNENAEAPKEKLTPKKAGSNIMAFLAGSMTPLIPAMITAAMFKTIQVAFGPDMLSTIFVPFLTMLVLLPLELCLLAPLGSILGNYIGNGLLVFGDFGGFIAVAIVAALWEFLVMTGMHQVLIVFGIACIATNGVDTFVLTAGGYATWAAFGMALGAFLRIKNKEEKSLAPVPN